MSVLSSQEGIGETKAYSTKTYLTPNGSFAAAWFIKYEKTIHDTRLAVNYAIIQGTWWNTAQDRSCVCVALSWS